MGLSSSRILFCSASRIAILAATSALTACSGSNLFSGGNTASTAGLVKPDNQDIMGGAAYWGAKYDANRDDTAAAVSFARNLRMMGGAKQAVTLLKDVVMKAPDDPKVLAEYGKALTAVGRSRDALPFLSRSVLLSRNDWTAFSAYGVALDQTGDHSTARDSYQSALALSPNNPSVEGNLAMSYVLDGRIGDGEAILRKLVARPDATAQMRQNLAMIATLKGNKAEAEQLARQDLSPEEASNNLAVLRQLSVGNTKPASQPTPPPAPSSRPLPLPAPKSITPASTQGKSGFNLPLPQSKKPARLPVTMSPIADDEEAPAIPAVTAKPKSLSPARQESPDQAATTQPAPLRQSMDDTQETATVAIATR